MNEFDQYIEDSITMTGINGLFSIVIVLVSIMFTWMLLQEVKWEAFLRYPRRTKSRMLQALLAIVIGSLFARFILDYWGYTTMLKSFVE